MATFALNHDDDLSVTFHPDTQTDLTVFTFPHEGSFSDIEDTGPSLLSPFGFSVPYFGPVLPPDVAPDSSVRFTELTSAGDEPIHELAQDADPQTPLSAANINSSDTNVTDPNAMTETNKRRTRRVIKPITQGNNRYGRRGQRRCHQCRKWKQKCEYESIELPCKLCKERGFECGVAQKVKGPKGLLDDGKGPRKEPAQIVSTIPQQPKSPMDEMITDLDRRYLLSRRAGMSFPLTIVFRPGKPRENIFYQVPEFPLCSKAFRFSLLAFHSALNAIGGNPDYPGLPSPHLSHEHSLEYINKFHRYIKEAIHLSSFVEIFFASHMAVLFEYLKPTEPISRTANMAVHAKGMLVCMSRLIDGVGLSSPSQVGLYTIQRLHHFLTNTFTFTVRGYFSCTSDLGPSEAEIEKFHELGMSLVNFQAQFREGRNGVCGIEFLGLCLNMELHSFLRLRKCRSQKKLVESIKTTIQIIQQITNVIMDDDRHYATRELIANFMVDEDQGHPLEPEIPVGNAGSDILFPGDIVSFLAIYGMAIIANQIITPNVNVEAALSRNRFLSRLFCWLTSRLHTDSIYRKELLRHLFWLAMAVKKEIDVDTKVLVRVMLINLMKTKDTPLLGRLLELFDMVSSWTVEEVLLGSRLDDEDILRCNYELNKAFPFSHLIWN